MIRWQMGAGVLDPETPNKAGETALDLAEQNRCAFLLVHFPHDVLQS